MAAPTSVGTQGQSGTHGSDTVTLTAAIPAGALVLVLWYANASRTLSSIGGTAGLSWQNDGGRAGNAANGGSTWIYSAIAASGVASGATVVANFTSGSITSMMRVVYITNPLSSGWFDVTQSNFASTSAAPWDTGTTAARAQAEEISVSVCGNSGGSSATSTTDSPAQEIGEVVVGTRNMVVSYEEHSSTGTTLIQGDWSSAQQWSATVVSYKLAGGGPVTVPLNAASATATASASVTAPTQVALSSAPAAASATLALTAPTQVPLSSAGASASATASLTAPTQVPLQPAGAAASASAQVTAPTRVPLSGATAAASGANLQIDVIPYVGLNPAVAQASASASITTGAAPGLSPAQASAFGAPMVITAPSYVGLTPASSAAGGSLALSAPTRVTLQLATAAAAGADLPLMRPEVVPLQAASATAAGSVTISIGGGELPPSPAGSIIGGSPRGRFRRARGGRVEGPGGGTIA